MPMLPALTETERAHLLLWFRKACLHFSAAKRGETKARHLAIMCYQVALEWVIPENEPQLWFEAKKCLAELQQG